MRKAILCLVTLSSILLITNGLLSQGAKEKKGTSKKDVAGKEFKEQEGYRRDIGTYLDRFESARRGRHLINDNLYKIRTLEIIVGNFGSDKKSSLQDIKDQYVKAKKLYYQNIYNRAIKVFDENKEKIKTLFSEFSSDYKKKSAGILEQCASQLTEFEINEVSNEPGAEYSTTNRKIDQNRLRLKIAYQQQRLGNKMVFYGHHYKAIQHYRLAKAFGISILSDLAPGQDAAQKVQSEYQTDLIDSKNKLASKKSEK